MASTSSASSGVGRRGLSTALRLPEAAAGLAPARGGRSSTRPESIVCRRGPRATTSLLVRPSRRGCARPHRLRRSSRRFKPWRCSSHRQSHGRRFLDSATTVTTRHQPRRHTDDLVDPPPSGTRRQLCRVLLLFGDLIVDEFIYGELSRVSREAPVLILDYDSTEIVPGGAGNAATNVAALGGSPAAVGVTGRDETGRRLLDAMRRRVNVSAVTRLLWLPDAHEDAHPRWRRALRQTAGRPHRSRHAPIVFRRGPARR